MSTILLNGVSGMNLDVSTRAWLNQLGTQPSLTVISAVNTFIIKSKANGNWSLLDRFWLFAQDIQANTLVSIVNPTSTIVTEVSSPSWTANQGFTGNGSSSYLNTNFVPSTNGVNFTQNNNSSGIYCRLNLNNNSVELGSSPSVVIQVRVSGNIQARASDNVYLSSATSDSRGLTVCGRNGATSKYLYKNGSSVATSGTASASLSSSNIGILALIAGGSASNVSQNQISLAFVGSGNINQSELYNNIQELATTIGFNV